MQNISSDNTASHFAEMANDSPFPEESRWGESTIICSRLFSTPSPQEKARNSGGEEEVYSVAERLSTAHKVFATLSDAALAIESQVEIEVEETPNETEVCINETRGSKKGSGSC